MKNLRQYSIVQNNKHIVLYISSLEWNIRVLISTWDTTENMEWNYLTIASLEISYWKMYSHKQLIYVWKSLRRKFFDTSMIYRIMYKLTFL